MSGQGFYGFPNILGLLRGTNLKVLGKAGATAGAGLAGGTPSGAPTSGSFDVGEAVIGQDGSLWICTVAGTPGTWAQVGGGALSVTTKGDLQTYSTAADRLGAGGDGLYLITDSTQSTGLKWSGAPPSSAPAPAVLCHNSANWTVASSSTVVVTWDTTDLDQGTASAQHSTSSNTSRLVCRQAGVYVATAVLLYTCSTGEVRAKIQKNGAGTNSGTDYAELNFPSSSSFASFVTASTPPLLLAVGDYLEVYARQTSGSGATVTGGASASYFGMARVDSGSGALLLTTTQAANYSIPSVTTLTIVGAASKTMTLPTAVGAAGGACVVKNNASGTSTTVATTSAQTIDGASTYSLASAWATATFVSDGSNWVVV